MLTRAKSKSVSLSLSGKEKIQKNLRFQKEMEKKIKNRKVHEHVKCFSPFLCTFKARVTHSNFNQLFLICLQLQVKND